MRSSAVDGSRKQGLIHVLYCTCQLASCVVVGRGGLVEVIMLLFI